MESKIYREVCDCRDHGYTFTHYSQQDELERELERLREKLARSQRKASKNSTEPPTQSPVVGNDKLRSVGTAASTQDVCEICERPGHDIFSCDLLKDGVPSTTLSNATALEELFCEDCEGRGHTAVNCPHSLDVF